MATGTISRVVYIGNIYRNQFWKIFIFKQVSKRWMCDLNLISKGNGVDVLNFLINIIILQIYTGPISTLHYF